MPMKQYVTVEEIENGYRKLSDDESRLCTDLIAEASTLIDAYALSADEGIKKIVAKRMIRRAIASSGAGTVPFGSNGGTVSAMGYSQSFTMTGTVGEVYLSRAEKNMLGSKARIGFSSSLEEAKA